ncbi:phosphate propanoyltransferase [candidate division KSB1 bacterium]|nr:phosphate propanoyltransferase [candidate division KSB1 bacterium]
MNTQSSAALEQKIAQIVREVVDSYVTAVTPAKIPIGISARHLHITQEHLEQLFGAGYHLTKMKDLPQPGEFAANETVTVVGPNRRIFEKVRILGDIRKFTQLELAYSDGVYLGMKLPHRLSGDIKGSAPLILVGPKGVLHLTEGAIRAMRHLHLNPEDAARFGVQHGDKVSVRVGHEMGLTLHNVVARVQSGLNLFMHIDTDEANAAGLTADNAFGIIVKEK